jgi:hypothetical protein
MGLAASNSWISQRISRGNTDESESLRGRETVLGFHAGKVGHANAARLKSTASRTFFKDGEPYTLRGVSTVRRGGHAIPTGSTVPTLLNVALVVSLEVFGRYTDRRTPMGSIVHAPLRDTAVLLTLWNATSPESGAGSPASPRHGWAAPVWHRSCTLVRCRGGLARASSCSQPCSLC